LGREMKSETPESSAIQEIYDLLDYVFTHEWVIQKNRSGNTDEGRFKLIKCFLNGFPRGPVFVTDSLLGVLEKIQTIDAEIKIEYSGNSDRRLLCPQVKKLFLKVREGKITHPAAIKFFEQSYFKALRDNPDSREAEKAAAQDLGKLYMNGLDAIIREINTNFIRPEDGKFQVDL
jgi:hypothetical protein